MKPVYYHCEADVELVAAAKYYQCQRTGLGRRFLQSVHKTLATIQESPKRYSYYDRPLRSCRVVGFPYRVVYDETPDAIHILAVMHLAREPDYWKHRH